MTFQQWLELIAALAKASGQKYGELTGDIAVIGGKLLRAEQERTGKTTEQILADAGQTLDALQVKIVEDTAKGE